MQPGQRLGERDGISAYFWGNRIGGPGYQQRVQAVLDDLEPAVPVMRTQDNDLIMMIKSWKTHVPERFWCLPVVGRLAYWGFRLGYPWNVRLFPWMLAKTGRDFPLLTNHFFVLRPTSPTRTDGRTRVGTPHSVPERQAMGVAH